jgi:rhamnosyl/mannosyltransferase
MITCEINTGTSFININNHTGIVITPNNSDVLKNAMNKLWTSPEMASKFGQNARKRYLKEFKAKTMIEKYYKIYYKLVNESQ